jgi:ATP-binding cassette, subfamily C (CFTR/MRP), member 1
VTHQLQYLPQADYIIVMDQGKIVEQGTYHYHQNNSGLLASMMKKFVTQEGEGDSHETIEIEKIADEDVEEKKEEKKEVKIIQEEERVRGGLSFHVIWGYIKRMGGIPIILFHAFLFIMAQASLVSSDW